MQKIFLKISLFTFAGILLANISQAQEYGTGVGIRIGGFQNGLTVKHFISDNDAVEGILGIGSGAFVVTGFYQRHADAFDVDGLKWFYGVGAHVGGISKNNAGLMLGADAILGLEWVIPQVPLSLTADLHPRLELLNGALLGIEPALSIRYTF
ncbi:MAG: hypothetical protein EAZ51_08910 [Sphingobacteriales bacterium]|nr:MAG: hypothetical protein EAZ64_04060 [Sphingobacteriales bacterium]TAF78758.1 MAG: hypothetical protein EAZ51_08910 [Sphingobacteriales bacterium]